MPALAKALDAETEILAGATLLSTNAPLMQQYIDTYGVSIDAFNNFALNAHRNARIKLFHALVRRRARLRWRGGAAHAQQQRLGLYRSASQYSQLQPSDRLVLRRRSARSSLRGDVEDCCEQIPRPREMHPPAARRRVTGQRATSLTIRYCAFSSVSKSGCE
jgi:hypothetical protein